MSQDGPENEYDEPVNCIVVYANRANSNSDPSFAKDRINQAIQTEGLIGVIRADGEPVVVAKEDIDISSNLTTKNETRRKAEKQTQANQINEAVNSLLASDECDAKSPEVNMLAALELAHRELSMADDRNRRNVVVVIDSGISTSGVLNFAQPGVLKTNPEEFAKNAKDNGIAPDLGNIDAIEWYCFGDTAAPQGKPLPGTSAGTPIGSASNLKQFYLCLLSACGAGISAESFLEDAPATTAIDKSTLPPVSVVDVPESYAGTQQVLREADNIRFPGDSSAFIDPNAARATLEPFAQYLAASPSKTVKVTGYIAHYGDRPEFYNQLCLDRANTVKGLLVELGAQDGQVTTTGGGWGPYGSDEENRCVVLDFSS